MERLPKGRHLACSVRVRATRDGLRAEWIERPRVFALGRTFREAIDRLRREIIATLRAEAEANDSRGSPS